VDHLSVEAATDQPDLADQMAPLGEKTPISNSTNVAQLATERLLRGLPFEAPKDVIYEDYVLVWLKDMGLTIKKIMDRGGTATPDELAGLWNIGKHIDEFLKIMASNPDEKEKVRQYEDAFGQLMNHVKGLAQQLEQSMQKQQAEGAAPQQDPAAAGKLQSMMMQAKAKADTLTATAALKEQHKDQQFQADEARKDLQTQAQIERTGAITRHDLMADRLKTLAEIGTQAQSTE
jgi:hypothetical protein